MGAEGGKWSTSDFRGLPITKSAVKMLLLLAGCLIIISDILQQSTVDDNNLMGRGSEFQCVSVLVVEEEEVGGELRK